MEAIFPPVRCIVSDRTSASAMTRRDLLRATGKAATAAAAAPAIHSAILSCAHAAEEIAAAGIDRVTVLPGKTYLRGWVGYGDPPRGDRPRGPQDPTPDPAASGPA